MVARLFSINSTIFHSSLITSISVIAIWSNVAVAESGKNVLGGNESTIVLQQEGAFNSQWGKVIEGFLGNKGRRMEVQQVMLDQCVKWAEGNALIFYLCEVGDADVAFEHVEVVVIQEENDGSSPLLVRIGYIMLLQSATDVQAMCSISKTALETLGGKVKHRETDAYYEASVNTPFARTSILCNTKEHFTPVAMCDGCCHANHIFAVHIDVTTKRFQRRIDASMR